MLPGSSLDELRKGLSTAVKEKTADQTTTVNLRRIFVTLLSDSACDVVTSKSKWVL